MKMLSSINEDIKHPKNQPGSFEWWYFDAIDDNGRYRLVIIFYEGIPFSTKYINAIEKNISTDAARANAHPGISISVYDGKRPVYYSLSEFNAENCEFSEDRVSIKIGDHELTGEIKGKKRVYQIRLDESLPCGDHIDGYLEFKSDETENRKTSVEVENGHNWFIMQALSDVTGKISIHREHEEDRQISFQGTGYHDHNMGSRPLHFLNDWYWGRFHFQNGTFLFYHVLEESSKKLGGWWVSKSGECIHHLTNVDRDDNSLNPFLLNIARRLRFSLPEKGKFGIDVRLIDTIDAGPFYQRFIADAVAHLPGDDQIHRASGIAEYIKPSRVPNKLFWPLVHMRYRYVSDKPHPVQRMAQLYRLTW